MMTIEQRVECLLLKHITGKSNRSMSFMLVLFSLLSKLRVSYKTIERLYSDWDVNLVLHNMHMIMLRRKCLQSVRLTGDGTGYALIVKVHYASEAQRLKDGLKSDHASFVYSFALMDLDTRLYIGYGSSFKSEKEAFLEAMSVVKETGISVQSLRLDRYFSAQAYAEIIMEKIGSVKLFLIPKTNATVKGNKLWHDCLKSFVQDTNAHLEEYFHRNQSESAIAEDKRRVGWKLGQKRPDRIATAHTCTVLWHNLCWLAD